MLTLLSSRILLDPLDGARGCTSSTTGMVKSESLPAASGTVWTGPAAGGSAGADDNAGSSGAQGASKSRSSSSRIGHDGSLSPAPCCCCCCSAASCDCSLLAHPKCSLCTAWPLCCAACCCPDAACSAWLPLVGVLPLLAAPPPCSRGVPQLGLLSCGVPQEPCSSSKRAASPGATLVLMHVGCGMPGLADSSWIMREISLKESRPPAAAAAGPAEHAGTALREVGCMPAAVVVLGGRAPTTAGAAADEALPAAAAPCAAAAVSGSGFMGLPQYPVMLSSAPALSIEWRDARRSTAMGAAAASASRW